MSALSMAELKALRGILRDAQDNWARVGQRPYEFGAEGMKSFDGALLEVAYMPGLLSVPEINDPYSPTPLLSSKRPQALRYRRRTWRGGVRYLWELELDDQIGYYKKLVNGLGEALQYSLELMYHEPFFRAKDTAYIGGWDRRPLLDASHSLLGAGTYGNSFAYATPSDTVIQQIQDYFDTIPDPYGRPVSVNKILIFTSQKNYKFFKQVLGSTTAITNPYASGQVNPNANIPVAFESDRFVVVGSPYLNQINTGNVFFALGQGHTMFIGKAFSRDRMFEQNNPPGYQHEVWWSGNVGWFSAERVMGFLT